jgi:hypothetical protein
MSDETFTHLPIDTLINPDEYPMASPDGAPIRNLAAYKLKGLRAQKPDLPEIGYEFANLIADRLDRVTTPGEFYITVERTLWDLQHGIDGFTDEPIESDLVGLPETIYPILRDFSTVLAETAYSADFADAVRGIIYPTPEPPPVNSE